MAQATIDKEHNQNNPEVKPRRSKRAIIHRFIDRNRLNVGLTISTILQLLVLFFWYTPDLKFNSLDKFVDEVAFVDSVAITENTADTPTDGDVDPANNRKKKPRLSFIKSLSIIKRPSIGVALNVRLDDIIFPYACKDS